MPNGDSNTTVNQFNGPVDARGGSFGSGAVVNIHTTDDVEVVDVPATYGSGTVTNVFRSELDDRDGDDQ